MHRPEGASWSTHRRSSALIGIRTRKTLSSDEAWRTGHRAAAPYLIAAALTSGLFAAALAVVVSEDLGALLADVLALGGYLIVLALVPLGALAANRAVDRHSRTDA